MTLRQFLAIVEIRTKAISVSTSTLATLYAWWRFGSIRGIPVLVCFIAALFVDMGTTAFNSYFDFRRGVDARETNKEPDKVLVHEHVPAENALSAALGCFCAAAALGIVLAFLSGFWVIVFGAAGLAVGFFYSGGPQPLSHGPFGEFFSGAFLGTVLYVVVARVASGVMSWQTFAASLPSFLLISSILASNNLCDIEGDKIAGRRTLAIVLGKRREQALLLLLGFFAFGLSILYAFIGIYPRWNAVGAVIAMLYAIPKYRGMLKRGFCHETKAASMQSILHIFSFWTIAMVASFVVSILTGK